MSPKITNPILPGFNPDPSICRVGDDYYIATSSFEWYPGVQIHHSKDLINWTLVSRPLNRASLLDMTGCPDSCGVWAPCLTWCDGLFHLVYTDVKRFDGNFKDTHNYLSTCETIDGEWSERVYLNSSGFDPSLFHDTDGKKYLLNMLWDHRQDRTFFAGILLQEYSPKLKKLLGSANNIFLGSTLGFTEGPHLYKINNQYYLLTAEGGTGYSHAMTMARSTNLLGPYELDPITHFISSKDDPKNPIQRAGHGDLVQTQNGEWYAVHLASRPLSRGASDLPRSPLGRETCIQKLTLNPEGWFRLSNNGTSPETEVSPPDLQKSAPTDVSCRTTFLSNSLPPQFQWLRIPDPSVFLSLKDRPGHLRLYGKESIGSLFTSSLIAQRQNHFNFTATTKMHFSPNNFQQMAGLVCYYNSHKFYYLYLSCDEAQKPFLNIMACLGDLSLNLDFPLGKKVVAISHSTIYLQAKINNENLNFFYSTDGEEWNPIGETLDYSLLSDEAGKGEGANFTGAFIGMCCQDLTGQNKPADFEFFEYSKD